MVFFILFSIIAPFVDFEKVQAATATLTPNGDVSTQWTVLGGSSDSTCASGTHCDYVDEGSTPNTTDYVSLGESGTTGEVEEFAMSTASGVSSATSITIYFYMQSATNANGGTLDDVDINLRVNGTLQTATTVTPAYNSWAWYSATFTGAWDQTAVDSFQLSATRTRQGSGNNALKDDDIQLASTYAILTFTPIPATLEQTSYRWFENQDMAQKTFGLYHGTTNGYPEEGRAVTKTSDGGYAVTGNGWDNSSYAMFIAKYNRAGDLSWNKTYNGTYSERGYSIVQTSDGGYAITGESYSFSPTPGSAKVMFIAKYTSSGTLSWSKTWAASGTSGKAIIQTSDDGYVVCGDTTLYGSGGSDVFIAKFTSAGNLSWSKTWGGANNDYGQSLIATSDGGYVITGNTYSYTDTTSGDVFIAKFTSAGNLSWSKTWGGTGIDIGYSVIQTSDSGYAVTGNSYSWNTSNSDMFIVKYSSLGSLSWSKLWGINSTSKNEYGRSIVQTADGGYAITGDTNSYGSGGQDLFLTKYSSTGTLSWSKTWGSTSYEVGWGMARSSDGFIVVGSTDSFQITDVFLLSIDSSGNIGNCNTYCKADTVGGGSDYTSTSRADTVGGGSDYTSTNKADTVGGGSDYTSSSKSDTIGGGSDYTSTNRADTVGGGSDYTSTNSDVTSTGTLVIILDGTSSTYLKAIGNSSTNWLDKIIETSDGNFVIAGVAGGSLYIIKVYNNGDQIWAKNYGVAPLFDIVEDKDGNFLITGTDFKMFKIDSAGELIWAKTGGHEGRLHTDSNGNFYNVQLGASCYLQAVLWTPTGNTQNYTYNNFSASNCNLSNIASDTSGNIVLTGQIDLYSNSNGLEGFVAKMDTSGNVIWFKLFDNTIEFTDIDVDSSDNVIAVGIDNILYSNTIVAKLNSSGTLQWVQSLDATGNLATSVYSVVTDANNNIYIATNYNSDASIYKLNSSGQAQWFKFIDQTVGKDILYIESEDAILLAGNTSISMFGSTDIFIAKLNTEGVINDCASYCGERTYTNTTLTKSTTDLTPTTSSGSTGSNAWTPTYSSAEFYRADICGTTIESKINVGSPLNNVATNVATTVQLQTVFRLRLNLHVSTNTLYTNTTNFKLQYSIKSGTCDTAFTGESYSDVGSSGAIHYYNNAVGQDGDLISPNGNDPIHSSHTTIRQNYQESNNFTASNDVSIGWDGLWDFALITDNTPNAGDAFCFRVVESTGTLLNTYTYIPEISISGIQLNQSAYRWFDGTNVTYQTPTRVNNNTCSNGGATTIGCTVTAPTNGNTLIAVIGTRGTTAGRVSSITQTGATWVRATEATNANGITTEIWYASNVSGAGTAVTINLAASLKASAVIGEYSGLATTDALDKVANSTGNSTTANSGTTATTTSANQLWISGMANINTDTYSAQTNSFTEVAESASTGGSGATRNNTVLEEKIVTATGTANVSATLSATNQWAGAIATFKAALGPLTDPTVGTVLAAQNTAASIAKPDNPIRLRILLHNTLITAEVSSTALKLQYAPKVGTCDTTFTGEIYQDVSSSNGVAYYNNSSLTDGATATTSASNPTHGADTVVMQSYVESAPFTNPVATIVGNDYLWDISLTSNGAPGGSYCFRIVNNDNSLLTSYTQIPEFTLPTTQSERLRHGAVISERFSGVKQPFYWGQN